MTLLDCRSSAEKMKKGLVEKEEMQLTVLKTSLFFDGDGFTVYDCNGKLVFRVDSYGPHTITDDLVLMDPNGRCLLTLRRKRPSLHQRWEGFKGERMDGDKPIFSAKKTSMIKRASVTVEVYDKPGEDYHIEGCYSQRCCTIKNGVKKTMAVINRKVDPTTSVMLGKEVFSLCVKPGFDAIFAMGFVLILDQINGDSYFDNDSTSDHMVHPTT